MGIGENKKAVIYEQPEQKEINALKYEQQLFINAILKDKTPIVSGKKVSQSTINKIAKVLTNMNNNAKGKKLLTEFFLDGFVVKKTEFYQPINDMLKIVDLETGN